MLYTISPEIRSKSAPFAANLVRWNSVVILLLLAFPVRAEHKALSTQIAGVLKGHENVTRAYGLSVLSLETGEILFENQGDTPRNLASNGKLISTAAVMQKLGGSYRFETRIFGNLQKDGTVKGALFIQGGGDPGLDHQDLDNMVKSLQNKGVKKITGGVIVDDTYFDGAHLPPVYDQKNTDSAYRSSVGALGLNHNAFAVSFKPGKKVGDPPIIAMNPPSGYGILDNKGITKKGKNEALTILTRKMKGRTQVSVGGTIGSRSKGGAVRRRIDDPGIFSGYVFAARLEAAGIGLGKKDVVREKVPQDLPELLHYASDSLQTLVRETNETSNNMMAETLFKHLGATTAGKATWSAAQLAVLDMLKGAEIDISKVKFANGSGLYEADFFTPNVMVQFLRWAYNAPDWGQAWVATLPVGGKTGTLRGRMKSKEMVGKVRAKTGTLDHVVTLSGYVESRTRGTLVFSFLFNDIPKGKSNLRRVRRIQDAVCEILANL